MELTERTGRIEDQLEQLTQVVSELAGAQLRTEQRVEQLVAAQTRTEEQLGRLAAAQTRTEVQLAGLRAWQVGGEANDRFTAFHALPPEDAPLSNEG